MTYMTATWFATLFLTNSEVLPLGPMPLPTCLAMMHATEIEIDGRAVPWHLPEDAGLLGWLINLPDPEYPEITRIQCIRGAAA